MAMMLLAFVTISPAAQCLFWATGEDPDVRSKTGRIIAGVIGGVLFAAVVTFFVLSTR